MQQARPSPADVLGFCAYLFAMSGGDAAGDFVSSLAFGFRTLRDGYTVQILDPTQDERPITLPHPPEPDEEPAPLFLLPAIEQAEARAPIPR
jgi:hypothetical protein